MTLCLGVVVGGARSGREWSATARRLEQQGYASLLVPDTLWTPSPFPALAAAAAVTTEIHIGTWVLAAPTRTPAAVVREVSALQLLSDGRFELGIGAGRPDAEAETVRLGAAWGTAADRLAAVEATVTAVRREVTAVPPVVVTARGPRMLALAGRLADRIGLALPPRAGMAELAALVSQVRSTPSAKDVPLTLQLVGVGDRLPTWLQQSGLDARQLAAAGAVAVLPGDVGEMAERLLALQDQFGISSLTVPGELADDVAPVLARLG